MLLKNKLLLNLVASWNIDVTKLKMKTFVDELGNKKKS